MADVYVNCYSCHHNFLLSEAVEIGGGYIKCPRCSRTLNRPKGKVESDKHAAARRARAEESRQGRFF